MATLTVKATYSLDPGTVSRLEELARHWGVSKSEALRRAIRAATPGGGPDDAGPLAALEMLQRTAGLSPSSVRAWADEVRRERRAVSSPARRRRR